MPPKEESSVRLIKPNIDAGITSTSHKLTLVEQLHFVYVKIVRAVNLPPNRSTGTCDPFVELKIGNYKGTTRCLPNTPHPIWDQTFAFRKDRLQGKALEISVRDNAVGKNEVIGRLEIPIGEVPTRLPWDSALAPQWYRLEDQDGLVQRGELMLAVWIGNQADDAYSIAWHSEATSVSGESVVNTRPKVYMSPKLWYLRINLIEAQDLAPADMSKKPEAYVKVTFGNLAYRTKVSSSKTVNPCWNEEFIFVVAEPFDDVLVLSVEDKTAPQGVECLGRYVISLQKVERRLLLPTPSDKWVNLETPELEAKKRKGKEPVFASKLHLTVFLDGAYHVFDEPTYYSSDLTTTSQKLKPAQVGVLELGILKAEGLVPMKSKDGYETTDAYCVAKYGRKWARTSTAVGTFAPKWNEQYKWEVYDPCTVITIGVFDNCNLQGSRGGLNKDSIIGRVRIRLSTLQPNKVYSNAYTLSTMWPSGLKKMGELHLVVRFTCISMANLLTTYFLPLFPKAHYASPLSVYQIDALRLQAVHVISSRLSCADPPLRKEVVEHMLDVYTCKWGLRRGKVNLQRVSEGLRVFFEIWTWFDSIRKWKNSVTTSLVYCVFIVLIFIPQCILPLCFSWLAFIGIRRYFSRPKHPPSIDIKLSCAEAMTTDELDEEFDTFPTSRPNEVVRARYDRLRKKLGVIVQALGDFATQLERLHSLLTWRDPTATGIFIAFCLISTVAVWKIPFQGLLLIFLSYTFRPPRCRAMHSRYPQNFFRRMPAKEDHIL